jgi:thioredoxin 1
VENIFTDQNFEEEVLKSNTPVLVDFWAPWCAPCLMVAPTIKEIGEEFKGKIEVGKLNVDENPLTSQKYGIRAIPALMIFRNGSLVEQLIGVQPKEVLVEKIKRLLSLDK